MKARNRWNVGLSIVVLIATLLALPSMMKGQAGPDQVQVQGQGRGQGGRGGGAQQQNLPENPTAVSLPSISAEVTGPGPMYESTQSLAPGKGLANFKYEAKEYFIAGTANGQPYKTR